MRCMCCEMLGTKYDSSAFVGMSQKLRECMCLVIFKHHGATWKHLSQMFVPDVPSVLRIVADIPSARREVNHV